MPRAVSFKGSQPHSLFPPGEQRWPQCKCRWACGRCQLKTETFAPFGSNMRGYFSTYSCFFVFSKLKIMFICLLPLICLLSAPCQSLDGCSSSEVTLTFTKRAVLRNTPAYQCPCVFALRWKYIQVVLCWLFYIESVKLISTSRKKMWYCQQDI